MSKFVINGGQRLQGQIDVYGSKNAALPLLAASLLTPSAVSISNIPAILDVRRMLTLMKALGCEVTRQGDEVVIQSREITPAGMPADMVGQLRGSILLTGALLGRMGQVRVPRPGGDIIGARPIDVHLDAFRQLGAKVAEDGEILEIDGTNMRAGEVVLREFSVTATENTMLAAAKLPGVTTIAVAAAEPHVVALGELLTAMGARVTGAGTHNIKVEGVENLSSASYENIPDMLEAGSFILMAALVGSPVTVNNVPVDQLQLFFKKLDDIGIDYAINGQAVTVQQGEMRGFRMQSLPYPGIPTDLQAPFAVVASQAQGGSLIHDPMYEDRFKHITELQKLGAKAVVCDPHRVIIEGPTKLVGQSIPSLDIRSGISLVLAGLVAAGTTVINEAEIVDRGYADLASRLQGLGADISCVDDDTEIASTTGNATMAKSG